MTSWKTFALLLTGISLCAGGRVVAAPPQAGAPAVRATDQRAGWQNNDHMFASCVAIDNQEEIAMARFAERKTKNEDVREFAKMLISDHHAFIEKLHKFAPEATQDGFLNTEKTTAERPRAPGVIQQTGGQAEMRIDMLALHRELAEQCLADSQKMLDQKKDHFDECFVGMQIAKHAAMKTKLEVFQRHAGGELKEIFAEGYKTTSDHLDQAEKLMKTLAPADDSQERREKKS